jgi:nucleoside-diphosphate-sugar epimerase
LQNNTLGTWRAATAAAQAGVERFVLISTDKAVNPTNLLGSSGSGGPRASSVPATGVTRPLRSRRNPAT